MRPAPATVTRVWNAMSHPRGRDGRFIQRDDFVEIFDGPLSDQVSRRGAVVGFADNGDIVVRMATDRDNPENIGKMFIVPQTMVRSGRPEKGSLPYSTVRQQELAGERHKFVDSYGQALGIITKAVDMSGDATLVPRVDGLQTSLDSYTQRLRSEDNEFMGKQENELDRGIRDLYADMSQQHQMPFALDRQFTSLFRDSYRVPALTMNKTSGEVLSDSPVRLVHSKNYASVSAPRIANVFWRVFANPHMDAIRESNLPDLLINIADALKETDQNNGFDLSVKVRSLAEKLKSEAIDNDESIGKDLDDVIFSLNAVDPAVFAENQDITQSLGSISDWYYGVRTTNSDMDLILNNVLPSVAELIRRIPDGPVKDKYVADFMETVSVLRDRTPLDVSMTTLLAKLQASGLADLLLDIDGVNYKRILLEPVIRRFDMRSRLSVPDRTQVSLEERSYEIPSVFSATTPQQYFLDDALLPPLPADWGSLPVESRKALNHFKFFGSRITDPQAQKMFLEKLAILSFFERTPLFRNTDNALQAWKDVIELSVDPTLVQSYLVNLLGKNGEIKSMQERAINEHRKMLDQTYRMVSQWRDWSGRLTKSNTYPDDVPGYVYAGLPDTYPDAYRKDIDDPVLARRLDSLGLLTNTKYENPFITQSPPGSDEALQVAQDTASALDGMSSVTNRPYFDTTDPQQKNRLAQIKAALVSFGENFGKLEPGDQQRAQILRDLVSLASTSLSPELEKSINAITSSFLSRENLAVAADYADQDHDPAMFAAIYDAISRRISGKPLSKEAYQALTHMRQVLGTASSMLRSGNESRYRILSGVLSGIAERADMQDVTEVLRGIVSRDIMRSEFERQAGYPVAWLRIKSDLPKRTGKTVPLQGPDRFVSIYESVLEPDQIKQLIARRLDTTDRVRNGAQSLTALFSGHDQVLPESADRLKSLSQAINDHLPLSDSFNKSVEEFLSLVYASATTPEVVRLYNQMRSDYVEHLRNSDIERVNLVVEQESDTNSAEKFLLDLRRLRLRRGDDPALDRDLADIVEQSMPGIDLSDLGHVRLKEVMARADRRADRLEGAPNSMATHRLEDVATIFDHDLPALGPGTVREELHPATPKDYLKVLSKLMKTYYGDRSNQDREVEREFRVIAEKLRDLDLNPEDMDIDNELFWRLRRTALRIAHPKTGIVYISDVDRNFVEQIIGAVWNRITEQDSS